MSAWVRVGIILFIIIVDDVIRETVISVLATKDLLLSGIDIVVGKLRGIWRASSR